MRVGTLEIQMMASMARLSKDMNDAQRIVGGAMGNVERSVASAKRAMQALGVGLPLAAIADQVRRMTDQYTKLDAQLRLATKSQAAYAQGMSDIRRISSIAQADIGATSMLYTRLINVMQGTGVEQSKLATVTETVSFGLKAYGATAQEASSAALQLSQAMGANRLGGEEFRAVMEAMPNVMKVLADSMGVPLGSLRQLSIDGKITADEMVKAFGNPAIAAQFKAMAEGAQTITGAWIVARNELMLLIGEFMKSSGATSGAIAAFNGVATAIRFLADNLGILLNVLTAYVTVMGGKLVVGLVQARMAQAALTAANIAAAESALFAAKANLAGAAAAARAGGSAALASTAMKEYAAASTAMAAASASSFSRMGAAVLGFVGGPIGALMLAITAAIATILNLYDTATTRAEKFSARLQTLSREELQMERQKLVARIAEMEASKFRGFMGQDIAIARSQLGTLEKELALAEKVVADKAVESQIARDKEWERLHATRAEQRAIAIRELEDEYVKRAAAQGLGQEAQIRLAAEFNTKLGEINAQFSKTALREEAKTQKELQAIREASIKYEQDIVDGINAETDALLKKIEQERFDTESIGKTREELALLQAVRYDNVTALQEQKLASLEASLASEAEIAAVREQIKARKELKGVWSAQATAQAAEAQRKAWKEVWDSVDKVAHDTFVSIMNGGKDTATRLKEAFKNGFFDWLYSMTLKKWIVNVSGVMAGGAAGMASAATGGYSGGTGLMDIASSGLSMAMSSLTAGEALTAASAYGSAALSATSLAEGISMATSGLSLAMPYIGAAIAGITLLKGVFGSKGTPTSSLGNAAAQFNAAGAMTGQQTFYGGSSASVDAQIAAMQSGYMKAAMALGIGTAATQFSFGANTGKSGQSPNFALGGGVIGQAGFYQAETAMSDAAVQLAASRAIFAALQGSDLPAYLANMFNGLTASAMTQEQINNTLAFAQSVKQMRDALLETRTPLEVMRQQVTDATGALSTSAATFRTDFVAAIDRGISPDVFVQWQALGNAIDQLAAVDAQAATEAAQAAAAAAAEIARVAQQVASERYSLETQLLQVQGKTAELRARELEKLDVSNRALQEEIWATQDKAAADAEAARIAQEVAAAQEAAAQEAAAAQIAAARVQAQAAQEAARAQEQAAQEAARAAQQLRDAWQSVTDTIFEEVRRIRGLLGVNQVANIEAQFAIATAQARAGDQNAARLLPQLSRDLIVAASATAVTAQDLARVQGRTAGSLMATGTMLASQYGLMLPSFAVGVNEIPQDMIAQVHAGETITPKAFVDNQAADRQQANAIAADTRAELANIRNELIDIRKTNRWMWQNVDKWDIEGMPEVREV